MRDRSDIREVVWGGESATARIARLEDTFLDFELFDIHNVDHLQRVDLRLNQNYLVGMPAWRPRRPAGRNACHTSCVRSGRWRPGRFVRRRFENGS